MKIYPKSIVLIFLSPIYLLAQELIPLEVGNYWKFKNKNTGETEYARVLEKVELGGETWFKYKELDDEHIFYVRNTENGQAEIDIDTQETELVLVYPVKKETRYQQYDVGTMVTPDVEVTVPAGTFLTYKYDFSIDDPEEPIILWVKPGLGPVKSVFNGEVSELIEFYIK